METLTDSCDLKRYLRTVQIKQCHPKSFVKCLRHCVDILNTIPTIKEINEWDDNTLLKHIFENINVETTLNLIEYFMSKFKFNSL